jgi:hypothetical protein
MKRLNVLLILVLGFLLVQQSDAQSRVDNILINEAKRITKDEFPVFTQTPKGARIYAVKQPSTTVLNAIDTGLTDLFALARKNNYRKRLNYSDYTIFIAKADRTIDSARQYSPDVAVPANQYAGTEFDKGGFIYAAGMVMAYNPCAFIIAEHTKDFQRISNVVSYEGEHLVLWHNDRKRFNETADHSQGGAHPILQ